MTEVAASLIGIATFGIKLTSTLYEFGANTASARDQTDRIARHLRLYSDVLEVLVDRIDDGEPIHSAKALSLVDEIYDQSYDLFDNIKGMVPKRGDRMSFMRKLAWNFKKSRVALVVSEIEYLKTTVTLLVTVLFAGRKIRSSRRKRRLKKESNKDREEVDRECAKVKIAIVEQINASAHKLDMQVKLEEEERKEFQSGHGNVERALIRPGAGVLQHSMEIVNFKHSLGHTEDQGGERALVLHHSADLITNLLDQWTTLADDIARPSVNQGGGAFNNFDTSKISHHNQTPQNTTLMDNHLQGEAENSSFSQKRQGETFREENHQDVSTEAYRDLQNRAERAEEELARLKASLQNSGKSTTPELGRSSTKIYIPTDGSSSESDVSHYAFWEPRDNDAVICDSDGRDLKNFIKNDTRKFLEEKEAEAESEKRWYDEEAETGQGWHFFDPDEERWEAHKKLMQAETAAKLKERDAEIDQLLRRRKIVIIKGRGRHQEDASGPQSRRTASFEPQISDNAKLYRPGRSKLSGGAAMMDQIPHTENPRTRAATDKDKRYLDPKSVGDADERFAPGHRRRPSVY